MSIENVIKHNIDHHNQIENQEHRRYWHQKLNDVKNDSGVAEIISKLDKVFDPRNNNHHIGDYYRRSGMKIDLHTKSSESTNLLKVINIIVEGLTRSKKD